MVLAGQRQRATPGAGEPEAGRQRAGAAVAEQASAALSHGIAPGSPEAATIVSDLVGRFSAESGREDDAAYRAELATQLAEFSDRRVERYWQLLAVINGWPVQPSIVPAYEWFIASLRT
jgi:hypothetical protein